MRVRSGLKRFGTLGHAIRSRTLSGRSSRDSPAPKFFDPFVKTSEYGGEDISPVGWIVIIFAWC